MTIKELFSSTEFIAQLIINVLFLGVIIFAFQSFFVHKLKPLTASETLKRENFLNAKRDAYYEAIEIANREYAFIEFTDRTGKSAIPYERSRGTKKPTEFEVNTCFSKLCIYSDNLEIPILYKKLFIKEPDGRPIQIIEDFVNLLREDLGYGNGIITPRTDEYQYILIKSQDTVKN